MFEIIFEASESFSRLALSISRRKHNIENKYMLYLLSLSKAYLKTDVKTP